MTKVIPANHVIDRQNEMNKLPEDESRYYIKAWCMRADTILYHRPFLHEMYGIYFVAYNRVTYHVLVQSAHHTHCISFNTNFCTGLSFSISISSLCFLPTVIGSA